MRKVKILKFSLRFFSSFCSHRTLRKNHFYEIRFLFLLVSFIQMCIKCTAKSSMRVNYNCSKCMLYEFNYCCGIIWNYVGTAHTMLHSILLCIYWKVQYTLWVKIDVYNFNWNSAGWKCYAVSNFICIVSIFQIGVITNFIKQTGDFT